MVTANDIQLFEGKRIRVQWDGTQEKWYFPIVDVIAALTDSRDYQTARNYWKVLKHRLIAEGNQTVTNCNRLKIPAADGKKRLTDVADQEQLFRLIQSIPSPKAEPFKQWMAQVASRRIDQLQDPELSFQQAVEDYRRLGYSDEWIGQRMRSIEVRKELTDEWRRTGVEEGLQYATLTDIITQAWSGLTTRQYKDYKGLHKESLRDNMTNLEITLNMLAEASATEISKATNPQTFEENKQVAHDGGAIARGAREELEARTGRAIVTSKNASDYLTQ